MELNPVRSFFDPRSLLIFWDTKREIFFCMFYDSPSPVLSVTGTLLDCPSPMAADPPVLPSSLAQLGIWDALIAWSTLTPYTHSLTHTHTLSRAGWHSVPSYFPTFIRPHIIAHTGVEGLREHLTQAATTTIASSMSSQLFRWTDGWVLPARRRVEDMFVDVTLCWLRV